jgi:DNA-directed RNA polymerase specialized sigma24 family protein
VAKRQTPGAGEQSMEYHDAEFAPRYPGDPQGDPWPTVRRKLNVVSLDAVGGDVDVADDVEDAEADEPERDLSEAVAAMKRVYSNVLTNEEQIVFALRQIEVPYATIAKECRLSGPSQARKIEQRALRKMRERLSKYRKILGTKVDKSVL